VCLLCVKVAAVVLLVCASSAALGDPTAEVAVRRRVYRRYRPWTAIASLGGGFDQASNADVRDILAAALTMRREYEWAMWAMLLRVDWTRRGDVDAIGATLGPEIRLSHESDAKLWLGGGARVEQRFGFFAAAWLALRPPMSRLSFELSADDGAHDRVVLISAGAAWP